MDEDGPRSPLDRRTLDRRRRAARQHQQTIRLRRTVAGGGALLVVVLLVVLLSGGGGKRRVPSASGTTGPTVSVRAPAAVRRRQSAAQEAAVQAALQRTIAANDYVAAGTRRRKAVALTFDDGPGPTTPLLLDFLKKHKVPATFFVLGKQALAMPAVVKREVTDGMVVGDHTVDHANLRTLTPAAQAAEIFNAKDTIEAIGGQKVQLFRPPYGAFNDSVLSQIRKAGLVMVLWSIDTSDFARPGVDRIVYTALSGAHAGSIILMHDGGGDRSETLAAVPRIVAKLRQKGYHLVTVPELLTLDPVPQNQPVPTTLTGG